MYIAVFAVGYSAAVSIMHLDESILKVFWEEKPSSVANIGGDKVHASGLNRGIDNKSMLIMLFKKANPPGISSWSAVLHAKLLIQVFLIRVTVRGEFFNFTSGCRCPLRHGCAGMDAFRGDIILLAVLLMSTSSLFKNCWRGHGESLLPVSRCYLCISTGHRGCMGDRD